MGFLSGRRLHPDLLEDHLRELSVVDLSVVVGVGLRDHLLDLVIGELLPKVHHAVLELSLADEAVAVPVKHSGTKGKRRKLPLIIRFQEQCIQVSKGPVPIP